MAATPYRDEEVKPGHRLRIYRPEFQGDAWSVKLGLSDGLNRPLGYYADKAEALRKFKIFRELAGL